jgi:hypothetical protein
MKIIDKTPLQDAKGELGMIASVYGTLKYGLSWSSEMEAQKIVIVQLERALEKGFVLIRNFTLPGSNIVIPLALIGVGGVHVIYVTPIKGRFEAKGDQWNTIDKSGNSQPARINLLDRTAKLARAFQRYLEMQKVELRSPVEATLISTDPGAHIDSMRPVVKVIKSDTLKLYINSLLQATPIWRPEFINALADRLVDPRLSEAVNPVAPPEPIEQPKSRRDAPDPEQAKPLDASNETDFAFAEDDGVSPQPAAQKPQPRQRPKPAPSQGKILGMSRTQAILVAGMLVFFCCVIVAVGAFLFFGGGDFNFTIQ